MEKIIVKWLPREGGLSEIYQTTQMQFAFLSSPEDGHRQCHKFALCRDFLHDAVKWYLTKTKDSIYSFAYDGKKDPPIDMEEMRMLVTKKDIKAKEIAAFKKKMQLAKKIINFYERMAGWKLSKFIKVESDDEKRIVWLFTGPKEWVNSPFLISMYTFLLRLGDKTGDIKFKNEEELIEAFKQVMNNPGKFTKSGRSDNDSNYLKASHDKLGLIMRHNKELFFSKGSPDAIFTDEAVSKQGFHDCCGILKLSQFTTAVPELNKRFKIIYEENKKAETKK